MRTNDKNPVTASQLPRVYMSRRHSTSTSRGTPHRRPSSKLDFGSSLLDTPCPVNRMLLPTSHIADSDMHLHRRRQFSTEQKTRRLRSMRKSLPLPIRLGRESDRDEVEPLCMEELMEFLREGNSIREL